MRYSLNITPYWLFPFGLLMIGVFGVMVYFLIDILLAQDYKFLPVLAVPFLIAGIIAFYILKLFYNCISGAPAIILTKKYFIINILSVQIPYEDIFDVIIRDNSKNTMLGLSINEPGKYFDTPFAKVIYKLNSSINPDDYSINLDFIKGDNYSILEAINEYRNHGSNSEI